MKLFSEYGSVKVTPLDPTSNARVRELIQESEAAYRNRDAPAVVRSLLALCVGELYAHRNYLKLFGCGNYLGATSPTGCNITNLGATLTNSHQFGCVSTMSDRNDVFPDLRLDNLGFPFARSLVF